MHTSPADSRPRRIVSAALCALAALLFADAAHAKRCPEGALCSEIGPGGYTERQTGFVFPKDFFDKQSGVEITGDETVDYKNLASELGTGVSYSGKGVTASFYVYDNGISHSKINPSIAQHELMNSVDDVFQAFKQGMYGTVHFTNISGEIMDAPEIMEMTLSGVKFFSCNMRITGKDGDVRRSVVAVATRKGYFVKARITVGAGSVDATKVFVYSLQKLAGIIQ